MKLTEAQRILSENGLIMEEVIVNTKNIDYAIEQIQSQKEQLVNLAGSVQDILARTVKKNVKFSILKDDEGWFLNAAFGNEDLDFEITGNKITVMYNVNDKVGSKLTEKDRLEITIKRIFRKGDLDFEE